MDPKKTLTEEIPETQEDMENRNLTEVGGELRAAAPKPQVLTEVPQVEEDEDGNSNLLLG